ncbi:MAG: hypothetical protein AB1498_03950 [bacterium]
MGNNVITFQYKFTFKDGTTKEFNIRLDRKTLNLIPSEKEFYPAWTELNCSKCPNCTLNEQTNKYCPIALSIVDVIEAFKTNISYEEVDVLVEAEERKYFQHVSLQKGLSSLLGIYMTASECPVLGKLKPMVCFHLPFASIQETTYRILSMYMLAQYFLSKDGKMPDLDFKELIKIYDNIQIVNQSFCKRLLAANIDDASLNAVVKLNVFADMVSFAVNQNMLDEIKLLFMPYLK